MFKIKNNKIQKYVQRSFLPVLKKAAIETGIIFSVDNVNVLESYRDSFVRISLPNTNKTVEFFSNYCVNLENKLKGEEEYAKIS